MTTVSLDLYAALSNVDEDLILSTIPPSCRQEAVARPGRENRLSRFMSSGIAAAVLSTVVALGILIAIVLAGQNSPVTPPVGGPGGSDTPSDHEHLSFLVTDSESVLIPIVTDLETAPSTEWSAIEWPAGGHLTVTGDIGESIAPPEYPLSTTQWTPDEKGGPGFLSSTVYDGPPAIAELLAAPNLPTVRMNRSLTLVAAEEEHFYIVGASVYSSTGEQVLSEWDQEALTELPNGVYMVFLALRWSGRYIETLDQSEEGIYSCPFRLHKVTSEPTAGLEFTLTEDGTAYILTGVGDRCGDPTSEGPNELVIPAIHNGLPVTEIDSQAFQGVEIPYITIPHTVKRIGDALHPGTYVIQITYLGTQAEWEQVYYNFHFPYGSVFEGVSCLDRYLGWQMFYPDYDPGMGESIT